jgi:CheY-like chemotaxis protein
MSEPLHVLVVDDQPDVCEFVAFGLQRAGFDVEVATNGREALACQQRRAADVVITDIFMPDMDGLEAIDCIKRQFPNTRIVAMSSRLALNRPDYLWVAQQIGADATLSKPFATEDLLAVVRRLGAR